jgi:uroporphyrinogen-III synthase
MPPALAPHRLTESNAMQPLLIVTRAADQAQPWVAALRDAGCTAQALPLLAIEALVNRAPLKRAWSDLALADLVVFVSANAVQGFFAAAPDQPATTWPSTVWAASTGPGTTQALVQAGVPVVQVLEPAPDAPQFDSEALWQRLQPLLSPWLGRRVWVVRGDAGRDWLADTLRQHGAMVQFLCAYRRTEPTPSAQDRALLQRALDQAQAHVWLFSSSQAVLQLQRWAPQADWRHSQAWASHPRIAQTATEIGFGRVDLVRPGVAAAVAKSHAWAQERSPGADPTIPRLQSDRL